MGAVRYRFGADRRSHWRAWLLRGVLFGLAGATVLAAVAAARRTDSAYDRFLGAANAYDVVIRNEEDTGTAVFDPTEVVALPQVSDSIVFDATYVAIGTGESAMSDVDNRIGREMNRFTIVEGRSFDPDRDDEAVVSFALADRYGLEVGDDITLFGASGEPEDAIEVVGIEASPGEFPPQFVGGGMVHLSPAFARAEGGGSAIMVQLEHGVADVPAFLDALGEISGGAPVDAQLQGEGSSETQRSIHLQVVAFWILAAVLALTAVTLIGQIESRAAHAEAADYPNLGSLGATRGQRFGMGLLGRLVVAAVAAVSAAGVAVALSPLAPIGLARIAEPDPGVNTDTLVLVLGAVVLIVLIPLLATPAIWADARRGEARIGGGAVVPGGGRRSVIAAATASAGAPPPMVAGMRLALEPGGGRDSVPVRSTLLGVTLAVVVLAAAITFAASLNHLLDTPRLYGQVWDTQLTNYGSGPSLADEADRLRQDPRVEAVAAGESGIPADIDGVSTRGFYLDAPDASALPPAIHGRAPSDADEIGLGARTADRLDARVGDRVEVAVAGLRPMQLRVSGILVLPSGQGTRLGEGGMLTRAGVLRLGAADDQLNADLFVRLAPGVDPEEVAATLPPGASGIFALPLEAPSDVVNFGRVDALPAILAGLLAFIAVSTLAHTLMSAARRRRRELALLKTIGFVTRQVRSALRWQSLTLVTIALIVGLPAGVVAGRAAWRFLADQLGVVPEPVIPIGPLLLLVPAALAVGLLVAVIPGRLAARTPPASVLRTG